MYWEQAITHSSLFVLHHKACSHFLFFFNCLVLHTQINIKNFITRILICDRPTEKIKKVAKFCMSMPTSIAIKLVTSLCSLVCVWVDYVYTLFSNKKHMISMGLWHGIIFFCCDSLARNTNGERRKKLNLNIDYGLMWDDIMWASKKLVLCDH